MQVSFKPNNQEILIHDEAKTHRWLLIILSAFQIISSSIQIFKYWGEYGDWRLYIFLVIFILFGLGFIFYLFFISGQDIIKHEDIEYFKTKRILGINYRYIKLKNGQTRLVNFKKSSKEIKALKQYLSENDIVVKNF